MTRAETVHPQLKSIMSEQWSRPQRSWLDPGRLRAYYLLGFQRSSLLGMRQPRDMLERRDMLARSPVGGLGLLQCGRRREAMLVELSEDVRQCRHRAEQCRLRAENADDPEIRADYLDF